MIQKTQENPDSYRGLVKNKLPALSGKSSQAKDQIKIRVDEFIFITY